MKDASNTRWLIAGIGFVVWVVLVFVLFDPLLRKVVRAISGIELVRSRSSGVSLDWSSATPGRGMLLSILWQPFLYFLSLLPIAIIIVVMAMRWYAEHKKIVNAGVNYF